MISMDFGQREGDRIKGVQLIKSHRLDAGIAGLRFLHPRLTGVWAAMKRADADIYYQRSAGSGVAIVAGFTRRHGRRMVFSSSSDTDFDPALSRIPIARDRWLYRRGLASVDQIVVQSERQVIDCLKNFGREAVRIDSCYGHRGRPASFEGEILWVGTLREVKRPELFLDLARRLPQFKFRMVGGELDSAGKYDALYLRAKELGNVEMTGFVPFADVESQFDGASILVNTSAAEGFPNTFLQAWSRGMPSVSFFDSSVRSGGLDVGYVVADMESMVERVKRVKTNPDEWHKQGERAMQYARQNNSVGSVVDRYEVVFGQLAPSVRERHA